MTTYREFYNFINSIKDRETIIFVKQIYRCDKVPSNIIMDHYIPETKIYFKEYIHHTVSDNEMYYIQKEAFTSESIKEEKLIWHPTILLHRCAPIKNIMHYLEPNRLLYPNRQTINYLYLVTPGGVFRDFLDMDTEILLVDSAKLVQKVNVVFDDVLNCIFLEADYTGENPYADPEIA